MTIIPAPQARLRTASFPLKRMLPVEFVSFRNKSQAEKKFAMADLKKERFAFFGFIKFVILLFGRIVATFEMKVRHL